MANELYALLEAAPESSAEELRRAYFKALRKFPPDQFPEEHQQLRDAWALLNDPVARREYDTLQKDSGEVAGFMEKGAAAASRRDWTEAVRAYKAALALNPDYRAARWQLARALSSSGEALAAVPYYDQLCAAEPENLRLFAERGFTLLHHLVKVTENSPSRLNPSHYPLLERIVESFERCRSIDPNDNTGAMGLARLWYFREEWEKARFWGQKAVEVVGEDSFEAFEPLFMMVELAVLCHKPEPIAELARRIDRVTPAQAEIRNYVGWQFGRIGLMVMRAKDFLTARRLFDHAKFFAPADASIQQMYRANLKLSQAQEDLEKAVQDPLISEPVRGLAVWAFLSFTEAFPSEEAGKEAVSRAIADFDRFSALELLKSLEHLRDRYPHLYTCQDEVFNKLREQLTQRRRLPETQSSALQNLGCGCLLATLMIGSLSGGVWWMLA